MVVALCPLLVCPWPSWPSSVLEYHASAFGVTSSPPPTWQSVVDVHKLLAVLLLCLPRRRHWSSHVHPSIGIFGFLLSRFQDLEKGATVKGVKATPHKSYEPGRNTVTSRPHSSSHQRYRTPHSSLAQRRVLQDVSWRRIRTRPRRPVMNRQIGIEATKPMT